VEKEKRSGGEQLAKCTHCWCGCQNRERAPGTSLFTPLPTPTYHSIHPTIHNLNNKVSVPLEANCPNSSGTRWCCLAPWHLLHRKIPRRWAPNSNSKRKHNTCRNHPKNESDAAKHTGYHRCRLPHVLTRVHVHRTAGWACLYSIVQCVGKQSANDRQPTHLRSSSLTCKSHPSFVRSAWPPQPSCHHPTHRPLGQDSRMQGRTPPEASSFSQP
jgi:hypothetical protein